MVKAINPSRMRLRLEFGNQVDTDAINQNTGEPIQRFEPAFSMWAGKWSLSLEQSLTLAGGVAKDVRVFFVRHTSRILDGMQLRLNGDVYKIDAITFDDGIPPDGFDLITCHKWGANHE